LKPFIRTKIFKKLQIKNGMTNFADVNGIKICYKIHGKNNDTPLILVSGWTLKKEMWIAQVGPLSEHFKVITFDNRGCGKSDRPDIPYTMDLFASDLAGLMDHLKINRANLMGYALGGMIVDIFALNYPERINKLILHNTVAKFPNDTGIETLKQFIIKNIDFRQRFPEKAFLEASRLFFHPKFKKELETSPDKNFYGLWTVADVTKEFSIDPQAPNDISNQASAMSGFDVLDKLERIKADTLLIAASHNRLHPKSAMEDMDEKLPNSRLELIDKSGDRNYLSRAPEINQLVIDFLKS